MIRPAASFITLLIGKRLRRLISTASLTLPLNSDPDPPPDIPSRLLPILTNYPSNWPTHPAFQKLLPFISPPDVSAFFGTHPNVNPRTAVNFFHFLSHSRPGFTHTVQAHSLLLKILVSNRFLSDANTIRVSMIRCCRSLEDANFVLGLIRGMSRDSGFRVNYKAYSCLLMMLARLSMVGEMEAVFSEMLEDKVAPNLYILNAMVKGYCQLGNVGEAEVYVKKILEMGLHPDSFTYSLLIMGHCRNKDVDSAVKVFEEMPSKGCRRNEFSYTNLIHGLCESGRVDEGIGLFRVMEEEDGCPPTVHTYTVIIDALFKSGRGTEGIDLFQMMRKRGCQPNSHTCTVVIDGMCKENRLDESKRMLEGLLNEKLNLKVATYNALIDGHCKAGRMEDAEGILSLMESNKCAPNERTFNELIHGFCKRKNVHRAMALYSEMLNHKLKPNLVTYNSLIQGHCEVGDLDNAYRLLTLMKESGFSPDQWTYCFFIDALCKKKMIDEAGRLFDSLKDRGISPNKVMYTAFIDGLCKVGNLDKANSLMTQMIADGCSPNSATYNVLMDGLCKESKVQEALSFMRTMLDMGVKPSVHTYTILISYLLKEDNSDHAHRVFDQMVSSGCKPNLYTYTAFIQSYCAGGQLVEAEDMLNKMIEEGIVPDSLTYTLLIDAYGHVGEINRSFSILKRMFDSNCDPSYYTYSILMTHLFKEKQINEGISSAGPDSASDDKSIGVFEIWMAMELETAFELFDKMLVHGCPPNVNTYDKIIRGLCKVGRVSIAQSLFNHMHESRISPNEDIYNSLLHCFSELKMFEDAMRLVDAMRNHGYLPLLETCKVLVCGLYEEGKPEKAISFFHNLLSCGYNNDEMVWKVIVDGLLKNGFTDRCSELVSLMEKMGCQIHPQTYATLMERLERTDANWCIIMIFMAGFSVLGYFLVPSNSKAMLLHSNGGGSEYSAKPIFCLQITSKHQINTEDGLHILDPGISLLQVVEERTGLRFQPKGWSMIDCSRLNRRSSLRAFTKQTTSRSMSQMPCADDWSMKSLFLHTSSY